MRAEIPPTFTSRRRQMKPAFTLVETLVVITIIAVLAAIAFSTTTHLRRSASSAVCVSKMSQIGSAILIFSQDRAGRLPASGNPSYGNLHSGQGPWYNKDDRRLQVLLGEYLGCAESTTWSTNGNLMTYDPTFAWPGLLTEGKKGASSVLLNDKVKMLVDTGIKIQYPWGKMLDRIAEPAKESAFVEVDQKNTNAGWKNLVPPGPIHGDYRNTLYFDWHVGRVAVK
jgi:prepilin-type N-terminal cleavage/methylation domain-containing protein/prepilin-type processing-associated H-X9-DG protein